MNGPSLHELQQWLKACVQPSREPASSTPLPAWLNPQGGSPGIERMSVYAGGYRARIREALAEAYEAVQHLIGDRAFAELADAYANRHPSRDYNLSLVGRHLPAFLVSAPLTQQLPFLPDLARLEWAVTEAFHAFDHPSPDLERFASFSLDEWEGARVVFQPSVRLIVSAWPIRDLWACRVQPRAAVNVDLVNRPQQVLIYRKDVTVVCEPIDAGPSRLLHALLEGQCLGMACGQLVGAGDAAPLPVAEWFAQWVGRGLIVRCERAALRAPHRPVIL
ncbi:MAG: putative DNA-binding domain-containing protein [Candidatus Omnitrophica bacterium]|nr:putative DNA-binding domain-containing protein [Candidatus Omnitrophota bacterium]